MYMYMYMCMYMYRYMYMYMYMCMYMYMYRYRYRYMYMYMYKYKYKYNYKRVTTYQLGCTSKSDMFFFVWKPDSHRGETTSDSVACHDSGQLALWRPGGSGCLGSGTHRGCPLVN
jgi:hypothetical protein